MSLPGTNNVWDELLPQAPNVFHASHSYCYLQAAALSRSGKGNFSSFFLPAWVFTVIASANVFSTALFGLVLLTHP